MFTTEIANRSEALKAAALLAAAAAFAAFACVRLVGMAIDNMQMADQRETLMMTAELLVEEKLQQNALRFDTILSAQELARAGDMQLHQMMDATLNLFVALEQPARSSFAIEADLRLAAATSGELARTGTDLANELNAALMFETLQERIEAISAERNRRETGITIG